MLCVMFASICLVDWSRAMVGGREQAGGSCSSLVKRQWSPGMLLVQRNKSGVGRSKIYFWRCVEGHEIKGEI